MVGTGVMLVTCGDVDGPLADVIELVADGGFEGVEFADWIWPLVDEHRGAVAAVGDALERTGLDATTAMPPLARLEDDLDAYAEVYGALGVDTFVVGINDESAFETESGVLEAAHRINDLRDRTGDRGFDLLYHNHTHEFVDMGDATAFDRFVAALDDDVGLELDAAWVAVGGLDPVETIARYADRMSIVHHKGADLSSGEDCEVGSGDLDQEGIARAAVQSGVEWLNYEYSSPPDPADSLRVGAERVDRYRTAALR